MIFIRETLAVLMFIAALAFLVLFFENGSFEDVYAWAYIAGTGSGFVLAYMIWPSSQGGRRAQDNWLVELLEILVELPVNILLWLLRLLGRVLRGSDDFDL